MNGDNMSEYNNQYQRHEKILIDDPNRNDIKTQLDWAFYILEKMQGTSIGIITDGINLAFDNKEKITDDEYSRIMIARASINAIVMDTMLRKVLSTAFLYILDEGTKEEKQRARTLYYGAGKEDTKMITITLRENDVAKTE